MSGRVGVEQTPDIETFVAAAMRAVLDPGSITKRGTDHDGNAYGEHMNVWQRRALRDVLAPVLAAAVREARAAELREAAGEMPHGQGNHVEHWDGTEVNYWIYESAPDDRTPMRWLRDRADRIDVDAPEGHEFLPVAGHPDDDECTYRADGTDATYCGEPRVAHEGGEGR